MTEKQGIAAVEGFGPRTFSVHGQRVMLDEDVAALYKIEVDELDLAVARNIDRFPEGLVFRLNSVEFGCLKSHYAASDREVHYVFTGQGLALLSSVLLEEQEARAIGQACAPECGCRS